MSQFSRVIPVFVSSLYLFSLQYICSYVFYPLAFLMGVDLVDCRRVAELIGIKTFINEFVAYTVLAKYIDNQNNLTWYENQYNSSTFNTTWHYDGGDIVYDFQNITLEKGILQVYTYFTLDFISRTFILFNEQPFSIN